MTSRIDIQHVQADLLRPNPWNSNQVAPEMERRLRASIEKFGLYKPIIVRQVGKELEILGGEHRWRVARDLGFESVPVVNLGSIDDKTAKTIGLADNGRYGEDDAVRLAEILRDIGIDEAELVLPYTQEDLAGMFSVAEIDFDSIGFDTGDDELDAPTSAESTRAAATHELMRFKVPVEARESIQKFIEHVIDRNGYKVETDPMIAAGMALVDIVNAARGALK